MCISFTKEQRAWMCADESAKRMDALSAWGALMHGDDFDEPAPEEGLDLSLLSVKTSALDPHQRKPEHDGIQLSPALLAEGVET